jgi:hypothetical protein
VLAERVGYAAVPDRGEQRVPGGVAGVAHALGEVEQPGGLQPFVGGPGLDLAGRACVPVLVRDEPRCDLDEPPIRSRVCSPALLVDDRPLRPRTTNRSRPTIGNSPARSRTISPKISGATWAEHWTTSLPVSRPSV